MNRRDSSIAFARGLAAIAAGVAVVATAAPASARGITKGPWVQRVTPTSAVIRVEVDPAAPISVELGARGRFEIDGSSPRQFASPRSRLHEVVVTGLEPGMRYTFSIRGQGQPSYGAFTTAPREDRPRPFHFVIYGDSRSDDAAHAAVVHAIAPEQAELLINTGDMVADGRSAEDWQTFFDIEAPLLREHPIFGCIGNHELRESGGLAWARYFGPGGATKRDGGAPAQLAGTFRWSNVRFFLLNGMTDYRSGPGRAWLDDALSKADHEANLGWRIVVVHHGPWSSGPHGGNARLLEAGIPKLFRAHGIDLVISGHDHIYERGWADGMAYVVSGGAGAPLYQVKERSPFSRKVASTRHFIEASVSKAAIQLVAKRVDGSIIERCALRKSAGWGCDGVKTPASAGSAPTPAAGSSAPKTVASRCGCKTAGRGAGARGAVASFALIVAALGLRRRRTEA